MMDRRTLLLSLAAQAAAKVATPAPSADKAAVELFSSEALYLPQAHTLAALVAAKGGETEWGQQYGQWLAMMGDPLGAWRETLKAFGPPDPEPVPDLAGARAEDAVEAIARAAKGRRVITLNDDHPTSLTRAFAHRVALRLGEDGFTVFAAETFVNPANPDFAALQMRRGPVTTGIGFYTGDPVYAEMVRDLRDRGWILAAYEQRDDQQTLAGPDGKPLDGFESREEAQARNLAQLVASNPRARILVFCGEGHALKRRESGPPLMGGRLERLGVDVLAVNQTYGLPAPRPSDDGPRVAAVLAKFKPSAAVAVFDRTGKPLSTPHVPQGGYDLEVFHPHLSETDGRPGWLARAPNRRAARAELPAGLLQGSLVQAVPQSEAGTPNVVPSDQYPLAASGVRTAVFFLRPGRYQVRVETDTGRRVLGSIQA